MPGPCNMKERKHIDRLYQEKFRDFEAMPREQVWKSISAKLREPEQKKPMLTPLWSRLAGVAAVLAFILLIGDWIFPSSNRSAVVNEEIKEGIKNTNSSLAENSQLLPLKPSKGSLPPAEETEENFVSGKNYPEQKMILDNSSLEKKSITQNKQELSARERTLAGTNRLSSLKEQAISQAIEKEKKQIASESSRGSFEVKTHAAPIYQGNFGKGNFLDPRFSEKSGEAEITYSYGINIAYNISERIKIRSGINKVNMSYNTNGIAYQAVVGPVDIEGVAFSQPDLTGTETSAKIPAGYTDRSSVGSLYTGMLNQKMGFIEVPVELEYNLIKKRFELNLIGGASTLFLDENEVSLNSNNVMAFGKAKNLKEVSFSTNIGLGLDYNLSEHFKLNFEPMLKYQLNTFSSNSADNQPYYFGIYSGFSYKF